LSGAEDDLLAKHAAVCELEAPAERPLLADCSLLRSSELRARSGYTVCSEAVLQ